MNPSASFFRYADEVINVAAKQVEFESAGGGLGGRGDVAHHSRGRCDPKQQRRKHLVGDVFILGKLQDVLRQRLREPVKFITGFPVVFVEQVVVVWHRYAIMLAGFGAGGGSPHATNLIPLNHKKISFS
jgi:hypothetical protein